MKKTNNKTTQPKFRKRENHLEAMKREVRRMVIDRHGIVHTFNDQDEHKDFLEQRDRVGYM